MAKRSCCLNPLTQLSHSFHLPRFTNSHFQTPASLMSTHPHNDDITRWNRKSFEGGEKRSIWAMSYQTLPNKEKFCFTEYMIYFLPFTFTCQAAYGEGTAEFRWYGALSEYRGPPLVWLFRQNVQRYLPDQQRGRRGHKSREKYVYSEQICQKEHKVEYIFIYGCSEFEMSWPLYWLNYSMQFMLILKHLELAFVVVYSIHLITDEKLE